MLLQKKSLHLFNRIRQFVYFNKNFLYSVVYIVGFTTSFNRWDRAKYISIHIIVDMFGLCWTNMSNRAILPYGTQWLPVGHKPRGYWAIFIRISLGRTSCHSVRISRTKLQIQIYCFRWSKLCTQMFFFGLTLRYGYKHRAIHIDKLKVRNNPLDPFTF